MMKFYVVLLAASFISILNAGCQKDETTNLDNDLTEVLERASGGAGLSFFQLPDSKNYSAIPQDPRNPLNDSKVELGRLLFHETGIALNPKKTICLATYSCATCHMASAGFQAGRQQGVGDGAIGIGSRGESREPLAEYPVTDLDVQPIRTPSILNIAYQTNILWNGQFGATALNEGTEANWTEGTPKAKNHFGYEGTEIQAIAGLDVHRLKVDSSFAFQSTYKHYFDRAFADVNESERYTHEYAGLAIAAFERTTVSNKAPWQSWLKGDHSAMTEQEKRGAILFFGEAGCNNCHTGPALSSMSFHALGMADLDGPGVYGNSPDKPENKGRGGFTGNAHDMYKFKVPQLYNLKDSPFYGHGGNLNSIEAVVRYKNNGVAENAAVPGSQLSDMFRPLGLSEENIADLTAFLENALYDADLHRYEPQRLPSGMCFPNNDMQSRYDMGCI